MFELCLYVAPQHFSSKNRTARHKNRFFRGKKCRRSAFNLIIFWWRGHLRAKLRLSPFIIQQMNGNDAKNNFAMFVF
jgi:hypothetical protein